MNEVTLVVGCSEERPNDVLAYEVMGVAHGHIVLSRRDGVSYTAEDSELSSYLQSRDRMLRLVLAGVPSRLRLGVGQALIRRWNRAWGVDSDADIGLATSSVCSVGTEISISSSAAPISAGR